MSGFWLTPAAPGTIAPTYLAKVRELHLIVRRWIEDSAVAQRNDHLLATLPYVDLMFGFGFATLGDHASGNQLVEEARKVMQGPIPSGGSAIAEQAITAALVRNFLFRALAYRISEALAGRSHAGTLSPSVHADLDQIKLRGEQGPVNHPYKLALYAIQRFREQYRLVDPEELPDPYLNWAKHQDTIQQGLTAQWNVYEPSVLVQNIRHLLHEAESTENSEEARLRILSEALQFAGRGGESFALELVGLVPETISAAHLTQKPQSDLPLRQVAVLEYAMRLAVRYRRAELIISLSDEFTLLVRHQPEALRLGLFHRSGRLFLRCLQMLDQRNEVNRLLLKWKECVFGGLAVDELRPRFWDDREKWANVLSGLLLLAGGWRWLRLNTLAEPIASAAREALLEPNGRRLQVKDYAELMRAYIAMAGNDLAEGAFDSIAEVLSNRRAQWITNTWQTAAYYSRFHLHIVEETVAAICQLATEKPTQPVVAESQ